MHYIFKLSFILLIKLSIISAIASDQEMDKQRIVREVYATLNSEHYGFADSHEDGHPTSLPAEVFEKKINPETKVPSFYSCDGVPPADAIRRLIAPKSGETHYIECSIASSICKYALLINALGNDEAFNHFSQNASAIWVAMRPSQPAHKFLPNMLLGNRADKSENFAHDLLSGSLPIDTLDPSKLSVGDIVSIANDSLYYDRHPYGKFGAENVVFYGLNESGEPLFFGFKEIFEDGQPHTLNEIQIAMLKDFLQEPTPSEIYYRSVHSLSDTKNSEIMKRVTFIANLGAARLASNVCKPKSRVTLAVQNIERIKRTMGIL